jgi:hypothetical protein
MTNPEIVEKWRSEFESEFEENMLKRNSAGGYINSHVNSMWQGFLMARESVVINLPPRYVLNAGGDYIKLFQLEDSIESQGYRVRSGDEN